MVESANDFERRPFFAFCGLRSPLMYSVNATVVSASAQRSPSSFLTVAIRLRFLTLSFLRALSGNPMQSGPYDARLEKPGIVALCRLPVTYPHVPILGYFQLAGTTNRDLSELGPETMRF
jgi:hypothetical protein